MDSLQPGIRLLSKLASIAVHADEMMSHGGHELDRTALLSVLADPEVKAWLEAMTAAALAPKKRSEAERG